MTPKNLKRLRSCFEMLDLLPRVCNRGDRSQNKGVTAAKNDTFGQIYFFRHFFVASSVADPGFFSPGFRIRTFSIPDPESKRSRIRIGIKGFKYFNPKNIKLFLSSRKNDTGYSSRIAGPGVKKFTGSRIRIRNTGIR